MPQLRGKLLTKVVLVFLVAAVIFAGASAYVVLSLVRSSLERASGQLQAEIGEQTLDKIDRILYKYGNDIRVIAADMEEVADFPISPFSFTQAIEHLKREAILTGPWDLLIVTNAQGGVVASSFKDSLAGQVIPVDSESFIAIQAALAGGVYHSDRVVSEFTEKPTMVFAAPIRNVEDPRKPIVGAVIGNVSWPIIEEIVHNLSSVSRVELLNSQGKVIASNESPYDVITTSSEDLDKNPLITTSVSKGFLDYTGHQWTLVIKTPAAIAFQEAVKISKEIALITIVMSLLALIISIWLIRKIIIKPIDLITNLTEEVAAGNFDKKISIISKDELGRLATSFNIMTAKLKDFYANLEKMVRQRTAELKAERDRIKAILTSMEEGLIAIDKNFTITMINPSAARLLGFSPDKLAGADFGSVISIEKGRKPEENHNDELIKKMMESGKPALTTLEEDYYFQAGERRFPVIISAAPLLKKGEVAGGVIVFRDITEDKRLDEAKTNFISVASHQLRTPLTSIRWVTEMFLGGDVGTFKKDQKEFINTIADSVKKLIDLVNVLLASTRLEAGRVNVRPVPVDLVETTNEVVKGLMPLANSKKIAIEIKSESASLPKINLELEMFRQVVLNLLSNAITYTSEGGSIKFVFKQRDSDVLASVMDTGIGIPKKDQAKIFEKFFRADNAISVAPDGNGLGLSLVKSLVLSWEGKIWFESEENKGTTFYFTIPLTGMKAKKGEISLTA